MGVVGNLKLALNVKHRLQLINLLKRCRKKTDVEILILIYALLQRNWHDLLTLNRLLSHLNKI